MILKPRPEPQTLSEITDKYLSESHIFRRGKYRDKISDLDEITQINLISPLLIEKIHSQDRQNVGIIWFLIVVGIISIVLMGIAAFEKIPILIMLMVGLTSICGFVADSIGKIFPIRSIEAVELTTDLVKLSRNSRLVSPCLKILSVKTKTSVAKSELAALAEVLAVPLYRMGEEEAKALSTTQLRALEKLVFDETSLELTISGLLVLGNAEFAVEQESTVRSWAQCPDRRGAAAREYLQAQGEMVGWGG